MHSGHGVLRTGGKSKGQGEGQAKEQGRGRSGEGRRVPSSRGENPHATDSLPSCLPAEKWRVSSLKRCKDGVGSHSMLSVKTVNHQKWRGRHSWKDNDSGPIRRPRRAGAREHASSTTCPTVALACRSPASTAAAGRVCSWSSARVFGLVTALRLMLYNG